MSIVRPASPGPPHVPVFDAFDLPAEFVLGENQPRAGVGVAGLQCQRSASRVRRSQGEQTLTLAHLTTACDLEGIDGLGLGHLEQKYLAILAAGPTRLNMLASTLGLPTRTVSQVTEAFLIRAGLIAKDDQGRRQLTALGREHVQQLSKL